MLRYIIGRYFYCESCANEHLLGTGWCSVRVHNCAFATSLACGAQCSRQGPRHPCIARARPRPCDVATPSRQQQGGAPSLTATSPSRPRPAPVWRRTLPPRPPLPPTPPLPKRSVLRPRHAASASRPDYHGVRRHLPPVATGSAMSAHAPPTHPPRCAHAGTAPYCRGGCRRAASLVRAPITPLARGAMGVRQPPAPSNAVLCCFATAAPAASAPALTWPMRRRARTIRRSHIPQECASDTFSQHLLTPWFSRGSSSCPSASPAWAQAPRAPIRPPLTPQSARPCHGGCGARAPAGQIPTKSLVMPYMQTTTC